MTAEQFDAMMGVLTDMRTLLVLAIEGPAPSTEPVTCQHPDDQRIDLSTFRREGFACKACKYQIVVDRQTGEPVNV